MSVKNNKVIPVLIFMIWSSSSVFAQTKDFGKNSIEAGVGLGVNEGWSELGMGFVYTLGFQREIGLDGRLRINPNLLFGGFIPIGFTDTEEQFYRLTNLGVDVNYDLIRVKSVSLVVTAGAFASYSRGLIGTGGYWCVEENEQSAYFSHVYFGAKGAFGIRLNPKKSKLSYELRPINIHVGSRRFVLGYPMFEIAFKLHKKATPSN
ncbi:hypothetical protein DN752_03445 [Echinicola strongylocentroti]|uniref:Outer membrane protein beta-barrel domain-containing protein n=1 Tax=Echinicola strongylocentroti TaxID=1795355 RepID=A0A2Z4IES3_9BACT|nr:hypothetical protein [Echinicola strongylocentroti]AWW29270.1 hypothetical protein DN752_03445 [Echinicola strongylocentroti]